MQLCRQPTVRRCDTASEPASKTEPEERRNVAWGSTFEITVSADMISPR